ncbi:MAG: class I SAM-dependent methyltransferase [Methanomicrobium sp.]|nr:class I SAM-dependent methyltransferase [Methanomicrobium sp.]
MNETPSCWDEHYKACRNIWAGNVVLPKLPPDSKVLEAGCGNGKNICAMKDCGWDITGFDFSNTAVHLCRNNLLKNMNAGILVSDAAYLPFKDSTFDAVFARHITGHSENAKRKIIAGELKRVLKSGGLLFFSDFEESDMRFDTGVNTEKGTFVKKNGIMTHFFSEEEVKELFFDMVTESLTTLKWPLRIRGKEFIRAEINAVFKKKA